MDTNLKGPFLTCQEFLPYMIGARDGCIVNVASTAGFRGGRQRAAYSASKRGLVQSFMHGTVLMVDGGGTA
jgi:NAD(P)-dependent dehydrogenase (short-subunit alcohol dehydrogenase family)